MFQAAKREMKEPSASPECDYKGFAYWGPAPSFSPPLNTLTYSFGREDVMSSRFSFTVAILVTQILLHMNLELGEVVFLLPGLENTLLCLRRPSSSTKMQGRMGYLPKPEN